MGSGNSDTGIGVSNAFQRCDNVCAPLLPRTTHMRIMCAKVHSGCMIIMIFFPLGFFFLFSCVCVFFLLVRAILQISIWSVCDRGNAQIALVGASRWDDAELLSGFEYTSHTRIAPEFKIKGGVVFISFGKPLSTISTWRGCGTYVVDCSCCFCRHEIRFQDYNNNNNQCPTDHTEIQRYAFISCPHFDVRW